MSRKVYLSAQEWGSRQDPSTTLRPTTVAFAASLAVVATCLLSFTNVFGTMFLVAPATRPLHNLNSPVLKSTRESILSRCAATKNMPGPPTAFHSRDISDRYESGTNATLVKNAMIFTGNYNGTEVFEGDILLDRGIVKTLGKISWSVIDKMPNLTVVEANGAWVTPGLVDLHSHLGVLSTPVLAGAIDVDSKKGPILPWLRTIDGLNTHDDSYELAMSGGVTAVQVSPGNKNAIGGQAFFVKLRKMKDRSASSMVVETPHNFNPSGSRDAYTTTRYLHQACGEKVNAYGNRMDTMWALRAAYAEAGKVKFAQDEYCAKAENGLWDIIDTPFPDDPRWEMLVDVLRGRVKVSATCNEAVDIDAMVRLSNEFRFPIASFHEASEAWLVPNTIKRTWGGIPTVALFPTNHRSRRETYRGSEFAGRVLADEGIPVALESDHPNLSCRHLLYEAQQAHYFGLPHNLALASVTSMPAAAAGLAHRIGIIREGADADIVLWDSHPLRLGATPLKVWIDGVLQIPVPSKEPGKENYIEVGKGKEGDEWKRLPETPNWDKERNESIRWDGLPPLLGKKVEHKVVFTNVKEVWRRSADGDIQKAFSAQSLNAMAMVVAEGGKLTCMGKTCSDLVGDDATVLDLRGGVISPGLMTYGSPLGLEEIASEPSTADGPTYDALKQNVPEILGDHGAVVRAVDGLMFSTRNALLAHRSGVTLATSSLVKPVRLGGSEAHLICGLSSTFRTGSEHIMQRGALIQDVVALHIVMGKPRPSFDGRVSVSTQVATMRRLLYGWETQDKETGHWFRQAAEGVIPLVIEVDSADIMANLLILKADVEDKIGSHMRMVFSGAAEAHLLAKEIGDASVGVILSPIRPFPLIWDQRRILPGPPLTNDTALVTLLDKGVTVGLGVRSASDAINTRFYAKWAALDSNERVSEVQAYKAVTSDLERLLGVKSTDEDLVVFEGGGMWDVESKVMAVVSPANGRVDLF